MHFEFSIGELTLDKSEATTLFQASESEPTIKIDLSKHIDARYIDSQKLFSLSVQKKNPALAALAAKMAIEGVKTPSKRTYRKTGDKRITSLEVSPMEPTDVLHIILSTPSLKHVGAAMILHALQERNDQTIREIAIYEVNYLSDWWLIKAPDSDLLRGFKRVDEEWIPFLVKSGLVLMTEDVAFGSNDRELTGTQSHLCRKVYKCSLSGRGRDTAEMWADPLNYIAKFWNKRSK
jgi:hypothetical protein